MRFYSGAVLDFFDDKFHLSFVKRTIRLRATVSNRICHAFYELASDTNHRTLRLQTSFFFGSAERFFAVADNARDISNRTLVHIAKLLVRASNANDLNIFALNISDQRFDIFSTNIKRDDIIIGLRINFFA